MLCASAESVMIQGQHEAKALEGSSSVSTQNCFVGHLKPLHLEIEVPSGVCCVCVCEASENGRESH